MDTRFVQPKDFQRRWYVIDAEGKVLGRVASKVAAVLRGKNRVEFTPNANNGDFVIVVNAAKVAVTGRKESDKMYYRHTGWQGHLDEKSLADVRASDPERLIENAVWGMLPKTTLGLHMMKKLKVYGGGEHPHVAQKPEPLSL